MGLLDILNTDDGRFGLGLLAAAAPRTDGAGFGQRLNEAVGSVDQFKRQKLLAKLQELQMQEAESSLAEKQAQRAQAQQMQELYKRFAVPGQASVPAIQGDAESGILPSAGQPAKPAGYDYQGLAGAMAATDPIKALQLQQMLVKQGPKFSTAPQYDQQGRAFILAEDGSMKYLDGVKARDKLEEVRLGDKVAFRSPYSTEMQGSMPLGQSPDSKASNAVTMRGQNMTDARARESNLANITKPFEVSGPDGTPVLVQQDASGNLMPVKGFGPKDAIKPMTDSQAKAALFGSRMQASDSVLGDLAKAGITKSLPGAGMGFGVGNVLNVVSPESQQRLNQAKLDFLSATLRRESGAVISDQEMKKGDQQYFPQIGDSPGVIEQKARNRAIAIRGVQAEVPAQHKKTIDSIIGAGGATGERTIVKTGVYGGRKVVQYSDGTTDYAN